MSPHLTTDTTEQAIVRRTITVPDAATALGISRNHAYELVASGVIPSIKMGRRVLIPMSQFEALLAGSGAGHDSVAR